jgi:AraC-like DNA-binding protein
MYRERWSEPAHAVLWTRVVRPGATDLRILPDGCLDLIWLDGRLIVAGPDTTAQVGEDPPGARYVGLRFPPGTGPPLLGVPAHELRDRRLPLEALWSGPLVRRLAERIAGAPDVAGAVESVAADRRRDAPPADPALRAVAGLLRRGAPVAAAADAVGLSERQLHRRSLAAFGYGPKTLARVLRLRRALRLARDGTPFADVAARAGYADQAHLAREVRALAGVPLGQLVGQNSSTLLPSGS